MSKIIVVSCITDGSIIPLELVQPIHERTATKISSLRRNADEMVATSMIEGKPLKSKVIHQNNSKSKRTIRIAIGKQFLTETGQRFVRIIMWAKFMVRNIAGELEQRYRRFIVNRSLPPLALPA